MHVELEFDLTGGIEDYAMFTELGNAAVHAVVLVAVANNMTWKQTYNALMQLSKEKLFAEATDTQVREIVYCRIGADKRNEPFYI
jgi:hypothetical protein